MAGNATEIGGPLRLRLFGGFHLEDASGRPVALKLRKAEALLAYVAVSSGQAAARQELAALLWGESEQPRARQSLRQVLLALSKALARCQPAVLQITSQTVSLAPAALSVDVADLERLTAEGSPASLNAAAALYRDDFLAGLSLDAPDFEDWLDATRSRLRDLALRGLDALLQVQEAADDIGAAVATVHQALRIDPFREDLHRRLMRLYARNGMRSSALAQFRACRDLLLRELGIVPDRETICLYEGLLNQATPGQAAPQQAPPQPVERLQASAEDGVLVPHYRALVHLLTESGEQERALESLLMAADIERKRGVAATAQDLLNEAQSLAASDGIDRELKAECHLLGAALAERQDDLAGLSRSLDRAERVAAPRQIARVMAARSRLLARAGDPEKAFEQARLALRRSDPVAGADLWLGVERFPAELHLVSGGMARLADRLAREGAQLAELQMTGDQAAMTALLALARALQGDVRQARADSRQALELAEKSGDNAGLGAGLYAAGWVALCAGDGAASLGAFDRALEIAVARGDLLRRYLVMGCRGAARVALGRHEPGIADLASAEAMASRLDTRFFLPFVKSWIAEAMPSDDPATGRAAVVLAGACNQPWAQSIAYRAVARAHLRAARPDHAAAAHAIRAAVAIQHGLGLKAELAGSRAVQAEVMKLRRTRQTALA